MIGKFAGVFQARVQMIPAFQVETHRGLEALRRKLARLGEVDRSRRIGELHLLTQVFLVTLGHPRDPDHASPASFARPTRI